MEDYFECGNLSIGSECLEDWFTENKQRTFEDCPKCNYYGNCDYCFFGSNIGGYEDKSLNPSCDECIHNKFIIDFLNDQVDLSSDIGYKHNFELMANYKVEYEGIEFILVNIPMEDVLSNKMLTVIEDIIVNQDYKHYSERIDYLKYLEGVNDGDSN